MRLCGAYFIVAALVLQFAVVVFVLWPTTGGIHVAPWGRLPPAAVTLAFLAWAAWLERSARRW